MKFSAPMGLIIGLQRLGPEWGGERTLATPTFVAAHHHHYATANAHELSWGTLSPIWSQPNSSSSNNKAEWPSNLSHQDVSLVAPSASCACAPSAGD